MMRKKEKLHKRCHTSKKKKKIKLDTSKSRSRRKSRPRPKARLDSSDTVSTSDTSSASSSDYEHHVKKNKRVKRFEATTMDSKSEVHVDTEVDTAVGSDNEPTPNLCHIEVENEKQNSQLQYS